MQKVRWPSEALKAITRDVEYRYFEFGSRAAAPLVLAHGFPDVPVAWRPFISRLEQNQLRVIVPYLRGFGETRVVNGSLTLKPAIDVPALHIQGLADACLLPAGVDGQEQCYTRGYRRVDVAGAGHFPHRGRPDQVSIAIMQHIE